MTTTAAAKTPARKAPQDRKVKADVIAGKEEKPTGWDLLRPVEELRSGETIEAQASILDIFESMGLDMDKTGDQKVEMTPDVLRKVGQLGALLENYASDVPAFIKLDTGKGAQERITELAMWFMGQLGESESSATS